MHERTGAPSCVETCARGVVTAALVSIASAASAAQPGEYPSKPIRIVIGFSTGSVVDVSARVVGQKLTASWKQQVVASDR